MHSVTSNAVYNETQNIDTWSSGGVIVRRIGKMVDFAIITTLDGTSPQTVIDTLPLKYLPIDSVRLCLINNSTDEPCGQLTINASLGRVMVFNQNGSNFNNVTYVARGAYLANN